MFFLSGFNSFLDFTWVPSCILNNLPSLPMGIYKLVVLVGVMVVVVVLIGGGGFSIGSGGYSGDGGCSDGGGGCGGYGSGGGDGGGVIYNVCDNELSKCYLQCVW